MTFRSFLALCAISLSPVTLASAGTYNSLQVNGVCMIGTCDDSNPIPFNTPLSSEPFSLTTTLSNGDSFLIAGIADINNNSDGSFFTTFTNYQITYLGDGYGGPSLTDTIDVNTFVAFETTLNNGIVAAGDYGNVGPGLGGGSYATYTGYGPTVKGPFTTTGPFAADYTYDAFSSNNAFDFETEAHAFFAAGSAVDSAFVFGSQDTPVNPTPEPASVVLAGGALLVLSALRGRCHR